MAFLKTSLGDFDIDRNLCPGVYMLKLINDQDNNDQYLAFMDYEPEVFSTEMTKELRDLGFDYEPKGDSVTYVLIPGINNVPAGILRADNLSVDLLQEINEYCKIVYFVKVSKFNYESDVIVRPYSDMYNTNVWNSLYAISVKSSSDANEDLSSPQPHAIMPFEEFVSAGYITLINGLLSNFGLQIETEIGDHDFLIVKYESSLGLTLKNPS